MLESVTIKEKRNNKRRLGCILEYQSLMNTKVTLQYIETHK
jgi:hypothetical protein